MLAVDTYALMEWIVFGNKKYRKYFEEIDRKGAFITELVLLEFYHKILHDVGRKEAEELFRSITAKAEVIKLNNERIKNTGKKRSQMLQRKKRLSYTDCLNLVIAEELKAKVLTGDKEFKGMRNVELVG